MILYPLFNDNVNNAAHVCETMISFLPPSICSRQAKSVSALKVSRRILWTKSLHNSSRLFLIIELKITLTTKLEFEEVPAKTLTLRLASPNTKSNPRVGTHKSSSPRKKSFRLGKEFHRFFLYSIYAIQFRPHSTRSEISPCESVSICWLPFAAPSALVPAIEG